MAAKAKRRRQLRKTVKRYQERLPDGQRRGPLVTLLSPSQREAVRYAARTSGESVSFVLAAIVAAAFGD